MRARTLLRRYAALLPACRTVLTPMLALMLALTLTFAPAAQAHPMPESVVWLDTTPDGLTLTAQVPLNRLEFAFGQPLTEQPETVVDRHGDALAAYLLRHVGARSGGDGGPGWQVLRPRLAVLGHGAAAELQAVFVLRAPPGADARAPQLLYDVVTHEVRTHRVRVFLRNDWAGGFTGAAPLPLGELRSGQGTLDLPLPQARAGAAFARLVREGLLHIATGCDHLLFLMTLLLAAPLAVQRKRVLVPRHWRAALAHTGWLVTAFTLGHTVTLVLGSSGWLTLPQKAVEVAVAMTVAAAACHAWRPRFARGDAAMALVFGLVHGMAFSASLSGAGLSVWQHAQALFAFNLGVEAMQLLVLALVLPPLLLIATARAALFDRLRQVLALLAGVLACAWIAERLGLVDFGGTAWLGDSPVLPGMVAALVWIVALGVVGGIDMPRAAPRKQPRAS